MDWRSLKNRGIRDRLDSAFHIVEREYGVTRLLDPEGNNSVTFELTLMMLMDNYRRPHPRTGRKVADYVHFFFVRRVS